MSHVLRVGLIGYGYAAATFHAPLIHGVEGLELAAISTRDPNKVRIAFPNVQVDPSPAALLSRPDIDLVVIPTPNDTHYALASQALDAGKHVVVDKPFTVSLAEAIALKRQAERAERVLSVFHNRRWDSGFLTLQRVIHSGVLGRIVQAESRFDRYRPQVKPRWRERPGAGSGLWYDLGPHLLDQMIQLFGMPESILLDLERQRDGAEVDDWFRAVLGYGSMRAVLHAGVLVPVPGAHFTVHGAQGTFVKQLLDPQEDSLKQGLRPSGPGWGSDPDSAVLTIREAEGCSTRMLPCELGNYPAYYEALRDAVRGAGPNPVPPDEAIQVMSLVERGIQSAVERRWVEVGEDGGLGSSFRRGPSRR